MPKAQGEREGKGRKPLLGLKHANAAARAAVLDKKPSYGTMKQKVRKMRKIYPQESSMRMRGLSLPA